MTDPRRPSEYCFPACRAPRVRHTARRHSHGWPLVARAQQSYRVRLVGILMGSADNAEIRSRIDAFVHTFQELGWIEGRNVRIDLRWGGSPDRIAAQAPRVGAASTGRHLCWTYECADPAAKGDTHHPNRVCVRFGPARTRFCPERGATDRQHHRFQQSRIFPDRQMAANPQGGCTRRQTGRLHDLNCERILAEVVRNFQCHSADCWHRANRRSD